MSVVPVVVGLAVLVAVLVVYLTGRKHGKAVLKPVKPKVEPVKCERVEKRQDEVRAEKRQDEDGPGKSEGKRQDGEHRHGHEPHGK